MESILLTARVSAYQGKQPLSDLMQGFPIDQVNRALRFRQEADRYRFVLGRHLLRQGVQRYGKSPELIQEVSISPLGKPELPDIWFSITHSGDFVGCLVSPRGPVGLDVEAIRPMDQPEHLRDWFTKSEWQLIQGAEDSLRALYTLWTQKEALLKAVGCGLTGLQDIRRVDESHFTMKDSDRIWRIEPLDFGTEENFVGHLCY